MVTEPSVDAGERALSRPWRKYIFDFSLFSVQRRAAVGLRLKLAAGSVRPCSQKNVTQVTKGQQPHTHILSHSVLFPPVSSPQSSAASSQHHVSSVGTSALFLFRGLSVKMSAGNCVKVSFSQEVTCCADELT